jgi:hypothetical protein
VKVGDGRAVSLFQLIFRRTPRQRANSILLSAALFYVVALLTVITVRPFTDSIIAAVIATALLLVGLIGRRLT